MPAVPTFIRQGKKQKRLILVFIAVVLITVFVFGQVIIKRSRPKTEGPGPVLPLLRKVEIDFRVLESPILKELKPFEQIPAFQERKGRENPFVPY